MKIGLAFDLKPEGPLPDDLSDDAFEEFDAPSTIHALAQALRSLGHDVVELGDGEPFLRGLLQEKPDFVFNFAEGTGTSRTREARVPAVCEMLNIPYTGSDPLTMSLALDKDWTRRAVQDAGVLVPPGMTLGPPRETYEGDYAEFPPLIEAAGLTLPVIAKPVCEGSSKGIRSRALIRTAEELGPTVVDLWKQYRQPVLVEDFIAGEEVTVGLLGNDPPEIFGIMSIRPKTPEANFVYSLEVKRDFLKLIDYACPASLPESVREDVEQSAYLAWEALGCRDVARLDFRIRDGVPYFLELNPLPGLNPDSSDLVIMATLLGVPYVELIGQILNAAMQRHRSSSRT